MKLGRKFKLALGIGLGAMVSTAAIATMAVSCGKEEKSIAISESKYEPSPEIAAKISKQQFDTLIKGVNIDNQKKIQLFEEKGITVTRNHYISFIGNKLYETVDLVLSKDGVTQTVNNYSTLDLSNLQYEVEINSQGKITKQSGTYNSSQMQVVAQSLNEMYQLALNPESNSSTPNPDVSGGDAEPSA